MCNVAPKISSVCIMQRAFARLRKRFQRVSAIRVSTLIPSVNTLLHFLAFWPDFCSWPRSCKQHHFEISSSELIPAAEVHSRQTRGRARCRVAASQSRFSRFLQLRNNCDGQRTATEPEYQTAALRRLQTTPPSARNGIVEETSRLATVRQQLQTQGCKCKALENK
ncbi:Hypothetical_protein [Hexamita inflata]|uniref:Hypothetical_protein n=1 Tax=Hexamita inflata TaxID=28002 RepID=A0AA86U0Y9_9EUKA|nr:Hypothetical protein HINF_LOCUS25350 [Hexamita inflata]